MTPPNSTFSLGQIRMESGTQVEHRARATANFYRPGIGPADLGDEAKGVDFPAPFAPTSPTVAPCGTSRLTSRSAQNVVDGRSFPNPRASASCSVDGRRGGYCRNRFETPRTVIALVTTRLRTGSASA